jgi:DMSO/TMAO reductase YedYZ molybdopterin-dependent catalytic subunit
MSGLLTRRRFLVTAAGASGIGAAVYSLDRYGLPSDYDELTGIGNTLTYATQRLLPDHSMAREFKRSQISKIAGVKGPPPEDETYRRLASDGFRDWRLRIEGLIARPTSFSLEDLKRLPAESHILLHQCEEGWSYIAEWMGVRLSTVLNHVGIRPEAQRVVFAPFANPPDKHGRARVLWESVDMVDAFHPQTLLAYGMNGEALPEGHGAPLRVRYGRQIGYKNTKFLTTIIVTDHTDFFRRYGGPGGLAATWYGGI